MFSRFFIDRPVFAGVIAIIMVLAGALAVFLLPVEQYPSIAPPTVQVRTAYPGADAATVADTVAAPLEQQVNGVEGMLYMSSISSDDGSYRLTVTFELGTDLDLAAVRVQNRLAAAEPRLPEAVRRQGVVTSKESPSLLMVVAPYSPDGRYDQLFLSNYASLYIKDALARVPGVGNVQVFASKDFAMRIWLDPDRIAARGLTTIDVVNALREQNVQVAAGAIGQEPTDNASGFQLTLSTTGRFSEVEQFENIVVKVGEQQRTVYLKDVARVELGAQNYNQFARYNGQPSPVMGVFQLPGSNALEVAQGVRERLDELRPDFPEGMDATVFFDFTDFVDASIREVLITLLIAAGLVFLTVFVFLQSIRATIIPGAAIPVSIVGTLALLLALGFSINLLTLFGLVLAIGIVVDDAIVVVENTKRIIDDEGKDPKDAAKQSMREITGPVVATTLVLLSVFIPTASLPGLTGSLFREFGVTLSIATVLSSVNALTLSPALCGILLRPSRTDDNEHAANTATKTNNNGNRRGFIGFRAFNATLDAGRRSYLWVVRRALRVTALVVVALVGVLVAAGFMFRTLPSGFLPTEDQGYMFVNVQLPDAAKLARTNAVLREAEQIVQNQPGVAGAVTIGGYSLLTGAAQPNIGTIVAILEDWSDRPDAQAAAKISGDLNRKLGRITEARAFAFLPPSIQGLGQSGGFDMQIQDRASLGYDVLQQVSGDVVAQASQSPNLANVFTGFRATVPQLFIDIDRVKAQRAGVPLPVVFDTLQTNLGSTYVNDFNIFGRVYQVRAQADAQFRESPEDVLDLDLRNTAGGVLPLSAVATIEQTAGPSSVYRYNLFPAAGVTGAGAEGVALGQAVERMETIAQQTLPRGFGYEWTGAVYQQKQAGNLAPIALALALVFAYLFLAAQYESWTTPLTILATVPVGALGALLFTWLRDLDNNVYTQIGLVLLIALVSKNAILIVEFAEIQRRRENTSTADAALEAASLRFRPILMTALSFVLGTVPLLIASGAGAAARQAIGTAVFGGMVLATFVGLFFIPTMYFAVRWAADRAAGLVGRNRRDATDQSTNA